MAILQKNCCSIPFRLRGKKPQPCTSAETSSPQICSAHTYNAILLRSKPCPTDFSSPCMASPCFAVGVPAHAVEIESPPASTLAHRLAVMCLAQARWPEGCCSSASLNHACRLTDSRRVYPRPAIAQEALHRTGRLSSASSQLGPTPGQRCSSPWLRRCTAKAPQGHAGRARTHNAC